MELLTIAVGIIAIVVGYFCFGVLVKFLLGWWILALGIPVLVGIGLSQGWVGALVAVAGFIGLLSANNRWHGSETYLVLERKVDKAFYFSDT